MNEKILVADDEKEIVELLRLYLEKDGFTVIEANDGKEAWDKVKYEDISLAVIDIMMPEINGFELVKRIRAQYQIPIIILSAKNMDSDKILGLGLGADDYITKPFNPLEIIARVQAQLRRSYQFNETLKEIEYPSNICLGELKLDQSSCTLYKNKRVIDLTSTEYKIINYLLKTPGRVYTKKQIFEQIWGEYFDGDDNTIMVHISKIREKIEDDPKHPIYLKTIRGLGYKFEKNI
ncbi:response regulator transcription factor [Clostridium sp. D2Q-11]|uniref:Response regulator transcription factor n=1 Tax=Anaeromonas frigoriresistens TaxID=2683708 RepID=A0A942UY02_9FIRM|nr:response regulator transcription factor [Anaeromonas frigoriresistens]MBS4538396.1 response regulator transcription factor [Anaeromonas frigoriresistens]